MCPRSKRATTNSRPLRRTRGERGTSAVEFAIVTPVFLLLIFVIIEAGLYFHARNSAESAAREGVSLLRIAPVDSDAAAWAGSAEDVAAAFAREVGDLENVTAVAKVDQASGRVEVEVRGRMVLPIGGTFEVRQTSAATLEQFRPDLRDGGEE